MVKRCLVALDIAFLKNEAQAAKSLEDVRAKKFQADVDKARAFYRDPRKHGSAGDRIKALKQKLPCARCGRTGHWKDDPECPLNSEDQFLVMVLQDAGLPYMAKIRRRKIVQRCTVRTGALYWITPRMMLLHWLTRLFVL